jgi:prophage maintenance system killer protein
VSNSFGPDEARGGDDRFCGDNHPFLDGNKRTAMMAAIVFLRLNGIEPLRDGGKWEKLMLDVAANKLDRATTTQRLRKLLKRQRKPRHG